MGYVEKNDELKIDFGKGDSAGMARLLLYIKRFRDNKSREEIVEFAFCYFLLVILALFYYYLYSRQTIPYTEGWGAFYTGLISEGKVPYRDFYYYLPPLNLLIDYVLYHFSFGYLLIYRLYRVVERIIILSLLYCVLCKVSKPRFAWFSVFLGSILSSATVFDLLGDYNQTCDLAVILLVDIFIHYVKAFQQKNKKKEYLFLSLGGIMIGVSFLIKPTIFVAEIIIYFLLLTGLFICEKKKGYIVSVLMVIGGALIPVLPAVGYLICNQAFGPFVNQVFMNSDSKGSIYDILLNTPKLLLNMNYLYYVLFSICAAWKLNRMNISEVKDARKKQYGIALLAYLFLILTPFFIYKNEFKSLQSAHLFLIGIGSFTVILIFLILIGHRQHLMYVLISTAGLFVLAYTVINVVIKNTDYSYILYRETSSFSLVGVLPCFITLFGLCLLIYLFCRYTRNKSEDLLVWMIIVAGGLISSYAVGMASGTGLPNRSLIILVPCLFAFLLSRTFYANQIKNSLLLSFGLILCMICTSQKVICAYEWWGWEDSIIDEQAVYSINISSLRGFRVTENVKNMYEEMYKVIMENSDESSTIYGFPHIKIFNDLCENYNMSGFVPVPFYDVCSDDYVLQEVENLKNSPPDIIVWCDIPYCMEAHENVFRGGEPLKQREIQEWFSKAVVDGEYDLIGQYDSLYVYKRSDGQAPAYTYFKTDGAHNTTLLTAESLGMVDQFFSGNGSEEDPYRIEDEETFITFRNLVNSGCYFKDVYFLQTADLDFSGYEATVAVGRYGKGTHFDGNYDGNQHVISGLKIIEERDTGLFGVLGGTVQNLIIRDCYITGFCCAGIACHAESEKAAVINCSVEESVEICGWRAGGIVDDFVGGIINCNSAASVASSEDQPTGKLYSYYAGYVINCKEN